MTNFVFLQINTVFDMYWRYIIIQFLFMFLWNGIIKFICWCWLVKYVLNTCDGTPFTSDLVLCLGKSRHEVYWPGIYAWVASNLHILLRLEQIGVKLELFTCLGHMVTALWITVAVILNIAFLFLLIHATSLGCLILWKKRFYVQTSFWCSDEVVWHRIC